MITKLKLYNFKSHLNTELDLGPLTLLTGINSSGKSSIIQSLLLLRQSVKKGRPGLDLNKPLCDIGKGFDALSRFALDDLIAFQIWCGPNEGFQWVFDLHKHLDSTFIPCKTFDNLPNSRLLPLFTDEENKDRPMQPQLGGLVPMDASPSLKDLHLFSNNFQYLSASRWANRSLYPMDSYAVEVERQLSLEYGQGELVGHFLHRFGNARDFNIKLDSLLHPTSTSRNLLDQTIAWESEISPQVTMTVERKGSENVSVEYGYGDNKGFRSDNVGFGLSYTLPVIVALLSASPGALLILENPESHLHPRGQSKLAELIALAAQCGIQIIMETHSDHIFNGIRKTVMNKLIDKDNVKIHFFELNEDNVSQGTEIQLSENGRLLNYKSGLFDQFDKDLDTLLGL